MTPQTQKRISLTTIADALYTHSLADARALLADSAGAQLNVSGVLLKTVKRPGLRLVIRIEAGGRSFEAYANFNEREGQKVIAAKLRKNTIVTVTGKLQTFGSCALTLGECRLEG